MKVEQTKLNLTELLKFKKMRNFFTIINIYLNIYTLQS